jgi:hypothetical protein
MVEGKAIVFKRLVIDRVQWEGEAEIIRQGGRG